MKKTFLFLTTSVLLGAGLQFAFGAPTYLEGNPTCVSLGYSYGAKVDPPVTGTYPVGGGTFTWNKDGAGVITWSSSLGIDAVIVKGGPVANLYRYSTESMGDSGLTTPTNPSNGNPYGISHLEICYDYNIQVVKTANTSFTREFLWSIDKQTNTTGLTLSIGQTSSISYTVSANSTGYIDKDRGVTGTISIYNPDPQYSASITNIQEHLSGINVICSGSAPYTIAPLSTLSCSYTGNLPNGDNIINMVYANTTGKVDGGTGSAAITFSGPTTLIDQYASIVDSKIGFLGTGIAGIPFVYTYSLPVGPYTGAGNYLLENTGTLTTVNKYIVRNARVATPIIVPDRLQVTKTAYPFYTRQYLWTIDKQSDMTGLHLLVGQTGNIHYTVSANSTGYMDKDRGVTGSISIYNPDPINSGTITSIQEQLSGANVACPASLPYTIAPHGTLTCTYTANLPNANSGMNVVYVNTIGKVDGSSGSAAIVFSGPTSMLDQQASIVDSRKGFLGTGVAGIPFSSGYDLMVGPYTGAGTYSFVNTGIVTTIDTHSIINDHVVIPVMVTAVNYGCVYSQGYWKTHSLYGPANKSGSGRTVGSGENAIFFLSNQTRYQVLNQAPKGGNVYYILAHQYIAAELNRLSGASVPTEVQTALTWAKNFFLSKTPTSALTSSEKTQATSYASLLDQYNNGLIGPMHCGDDSVQSETGDSIHITSIGNTGNANHGVGNPEHNNNDKIPKGLVNNTNANPKAIIAATKHNK